MRAPSSISLPAALRIAAALIACDRRFSHCGEPHPGLRTCRMGADAFRAQTATLVRIKPGRDATTLGTGRPFRTLPLRQRSTSAEVVGHGRKPSKARRRPSRKKGRREKVDGPGRAAQSRAALHSFEEACRRQGRGRALRGGAFVERLDVMVGDLVDEKGSFANRGDSDKDGGRGRGLSRRIVPKDASSLIRLLGRNGAHDAMLRFCRRYCRDVIDASGPSERSRNRGNASRGRRDAEEAVLFAYTASIAACSKPPLTSLAASQEPNVASNSKYRSASFLLSLLNEMEHGYAEEGRAIRPNSYTLTAVLLGIDDPAEAMTVLEGFEEKYGNDESEGEEREQPDNIVTVQVYNVVVASCSKKSSKLGSSGWQRAISLLQTMRRSGPQPNEQTYSLILQSCAEHGQTRVALSLLDEIRRSPGTPPSAELYLPLLKVCAKLGQFERARSLIDIMKEDSLEMTTEILNLYLSALAKGAMHTLALEVLEDAIAEPSLQPDIITFNTVLSACANAGDYEAAQALLDQMGDGIFDPAEARPNVVSYNTVISCADPGEAVALIRQMRLTRRNREGVVFPNAVTYVNAISRCRKASLAGEDPRSAFEIAMYLLDLAGGEDNGRGVKLNVFVYSASIWMAESVGDYETAVRLLREMKCPPNGVCYDGVISALGRGGLHREAFYFYYEMQQLGLAATRKTYQRLVHALDNARDTEVAGSCRKKAALLEGVLSRMSENDLRVEVGGPLFESLIRYHENATGPGTSYQSAKMVFDSIVGPVNDGCLSAMLRACSSANPVKWEEATMILHSSDIVCRARGPGLVSRRALSYAVVACARADQWKEGMNLIELYGNRGDAEHSRIVSLWAVNALIRACQRSARPDMAVRILNDMPARYGVAPNEVSYRTAIIACNQAEHRERRELGESRSRDPDLAWWECALSLLRRMREDDITPSLQSISSVISACEAAGQWQRAIGVLELIPLLGDDAAKETDPGPANLYCLNAAISACEKGGAWVEALQLYESIRSMQNAEDAVMPNFITVNSLLIALEKANQFELAESIYNDAVRDKILSPWKRRYDSDGKLRKMMDLHQYSAPMAKIAVRSYMDSLLSPIRKEFGNTDTVFIVGKGRHSEDGPILMPQLLQLFREEFDIEATIDETNTGRVRLSKESIEGFIQRKKWNNHL